MKKRLFVLLLLISPFSYAETNRTAASIDCNDRANEIRMSDQLDEAISVLGDCLSEELNRVARTYLLLGLSYYGQEEQNKAIANYSKAIEFAPAYVTAYTNRGLSYAMQGKVNESLADFETAIGIDPEYMQAYYYRAFTYHREGDYRKAIDDFNIAMTLTQDQSETATIYYNRGRAYKELNRLDDALSDYSQAIQVNPNYTAAYFSRGLLHHQRKNVDEAIADYTRTIAFDENHARAFFNRGLLHRKNGKDHLALRDFEAATDIEPSFARAHANRSYTMMVPVIPLLFILALG